MFIFSSQKHRSIIWNPNLGTVEIDIIPNIHCLNITVLPITVMWHFQNKGNIIILYLYFLLQIQHQLLNKYFHVQLNAIKTHVRSVGTVHSVHG